MGLERRISRENSPVTLAQSVSSFYQSIDFQKLLTINTQLAYRGDLDSFHLFLRERGIHRACEIKNGDIRDFLSRFVPATSNRKRAALKKYFNWANTQGEIYHNPVENTPLVKTESSLSLDYLSRMEVVELLVKAKENKRDLTLITTALETGALVSEIIGLDVEDISPIDHDHVSLRFKRRGTERTERIADRDNIFKTFLETLPKSGPLFRSHYRQRISGSPRLTRQGAWLLVQNYGKKIGRPNLSPQVLRNTFLMNFSGQTEELSKDLGVTISSTIRLVARRHLTMAESSQTPQTPEP